TLPSAHVPSHTLASYLPHRLLPSFPTRRSSDLAAPVLVLRLIVERDVAAHDREVERAASFGHALEAADELAHDLGPVRRLPPRRSEEHTSELQSRENLVCRLLLEKKKKKKETR